MISGFITHRWPESKEVLTSLLKPGSHVNPIFDQEMHIFVGMNSA